MTQITSKSARAASGIDGNKEEPTKGVQYELFSRRCDRYTVITNGSIADCKEAVVLTENLSRKDLLIESCYDTNAKKSEVSRFFLQKNRKKQRQCDAKKRRLMKQVFRCSKCSQVLCCNLLC